MNNTFDHLILIGRCGGGKSEFIDFIKKLDLPERISKFNIGKISETDDFVWLWEKFEEDDFWEKLGKGRRYSKVNSDGYVVSDGSLLDFLFLKFNHEIKKKYLSKSEFYQDSTLFIEFARGKDQDGGYKKALELFSKEVLEKAAVIYIKVSYEEARRRNIARYEEKLRSSVLAHRLPEEDMVRFTATDDWDEIAEGRTKGKIEFNGIAVPFVTVLNEPEIKDPIQLQKRYAPHLKDLWELYSK